jgi:hypothetical protein
VGSTFGMMPVAVNLGMRRIFHRRSAVSWHYPDSYARPAPHRWAVRVRPPAGE